MKIFNLLFIVLISSTIIAQEIDSSKVNRIISAEELADSLKMKIRLLENEINNLKTNLIGKSDLDDLVSKFEEEEQLDIPDDQKSSHRRLDALLKIINRRPGQVRFNGAAVSVLHSNIEKNKVISSGVGILDLFATTSFGKSSLFFVNFQAKGGNGLNRVVGPLVSIDANAGSTQTKEGFDIVSVVEAWANFALFDESIDITLGKLDLTNYFDNNLFANDEYSQFISASFVNGANLPYSTQSAGIRIRTTLFDRLFIQGAVSKEQNSGSNVFKDLIKIGSIGFHLVSEEEWQNNLRAYFYSSELADHKLGYGLSFDQKFRNSFGIFIRWGKNDRDYSKIITIKEAWSIGGNYKTFLHNKPLILGAAFGVNKGFEKNLKSEKISELYFHYSINKWVRISSHFQQLWNAGGLKENNSLISVRTHIYF